MDGEKALSSEYIDGYRDGVRDAYLDLEAMTFAAIHRLRSDSDSNFEILGTPSGDEAVRVRLSMLQERVFALNERLDAKPRTRSGRTNQDGSTLVQVGPVPLPDVPEHLRPRRRKTK